MAKAAVPAFPTRLDALSSTIHDALLKSSDGLIRLESSPDVDMDNFFAAVDPKTTFRFGILRPFEYAGKRKKGISKDPREVTKWRNALISVRRASPVIVLGRATGREEAGLRRIPTVLTESHVLSSYLRLGREWLEQYVAAKTGAPGRLFDALVRMAKDGLIDASLLSEMCSSAFKDPAAAHVVPQRDLWRVHLIPDARAQDGKTPGVRLSLNHSIAEFLRSAADSAADQKKWERLRQRADEGHGVATAALAYARTRNRDHLAKTELDDLQQALSATPTPPPGPEGPEGPDGPPAPRAQQLDLFDFLDVGAPNTGDVIEQLASELDLEKAELNCEVEANDLTTVGFHADAVDPAWKTNYEGTQVLYTYRQQGQSPEAAQSVKEELLRQAANHTAVLIATHVSKSDKPSIAFTALIDDYLAARTTVLPLVRWSADILAVLIALPKVLADAQRYLSAWLALVNAVLRESEVAHTRQLREKLVMLEAAWEFVEKDGAAQFVGCQLSPLHPFVLGPAVELALYARDHLGETELGSQILWAHDRSSPAYPAVWAPDSRLLLHAEDSDGWPTFETRPKVSRRQLSRAQGLIDVVRSYVGLHPYSQRCLSILLIDPPSGSGIPSALKTISRLVERTKVGSPRGLVGGSRLELHWVKVDA